MIPPDVREFLEEPHYAVMATINRHGTPQLTVMWYALHPTEDVILLNSSHHLLKVKNLRRDPRMSLCIEDGMRYVTLEGIAELIEDRALQERDVNDHIAPRYIGQRLGSHRWERIQRSPRIGIRFHIQNHHARGL
ncbi:MAG TPA: PPOX class F420-dependent oxidoreductase [Chloroflexota bacterium]|nr:PPOX class F420-dependent oxidoreductase [Chloroflexota bacterium]